MAGLQGISPKNSNWFAAKGNISNALGKDSLSVLKQAFGFKGVKILNVDKGIKGIKLPQVIKEMSLKEANFINKDIAKILGLDAKNIESVLVVVGGLEYIKDKMQEIKKNLNKVDKKYINSLAQKLGLAENEEVLILAEDGSNVVSGGLFFIKSGMDEIQNSIKDS